MGWSGTGTINRSDGTRSGTTVWQDADAAGVNIRADDHDTHDQDIADALENTVALDGQTTTTTDNAILRYDSGNTQFEGVNISASQIVGRSATGDTRGMSAATARQTIGVGSAAPTNNQFLYWASASSQYVQATAATARSIIGLGTAAPTNNQAMFYASASSEYQQKSAATARSLLGLGTAAPANNGILVYASAASEYQNGTISTANIAANAVTYAKMSFSNDIVQGDIANSAIGQGELKTTTTTETLSGSGLSRRTTAAGSYGMGFETRGVNSSDVTAEGGVFVGRADVTNSSWALESMNSGEDSGMASFVSLYSDNTDVNPAIRVRYFQASPPYNLGDGECGLFVNCNIDSNGNVVGVSVAPDPVWANNGPTDIRAGWIDKATGKKYKRLRRPAVTLADVDAGRADLQDYIASQKEAPVEVVEITNAYKNADMHLIPHSWASPPAGTICLLDPVNTHDLLMLHEAGEDVADLIHKGYIKVGDQVSRKGPPGVTPVGWKWKNTR